MKNTPTIDLIVTRHPTFVALMIERGYATEETRVIGHARPDDVEGLHVLGILPHHLSSRAASITEIPMRTSPEDRKAMQRGDLPIERLREIAGEPVTYVVARHGDHEQAFGRCVAQAYKAATAYTGHVEWHVACPGDGHPCLLLLRDASQQAAADVDLWNSPPRWRRGHKRDLTGEPWRDEFGRELDEVIEVRGIKLVRWAGHCTWHVDLDPEGEDKLPVDDGVRHLKHGDRVTAAGEQQAYLWHSSHRGAKRTDIGLPAEQVKKLLAHEGIWWVDRIDPAGGEPCTVRVRGMKGPA